MVPPAQPESVTSNTDDVIFIISLGVAFLRIGKVCAARPGGRRAPACLGRNRPGAADRESRLSCMLVQKNPGTAVAIAVTPLIITGGVAAVLEARMLMTLVAGSGVEADGR